MVTNTKDFYALMSAAGINNAASFDAYIRDVLSLSQTRMDISGFSFEPMQIAFTYKQLLAESKVGVMATYVDEDSPAIPLGSKGFEVAEGSIPRQKTLQVMDEADYRNYLTARANLSYLGGTVQQQALDLLFEKLSDMRVAHQNSMTYQRHSAVSRGKLELTDASNPRGLRNVSFDFQVPVANKTTLALTKRWFTDAAKSVEGADSNPIADLKALVQKAEDANVNGYHIEVDKKSIKQDLNHSKIKAAIGAYVNPLVNLAADPEAAAIGIASAIGDDQQIDILSKIIGCPIVVIDSKVAVEKYNKATKSLERTPFSAFEANTYVIVPNGNIGTIKSVMPLIPDSSAISGRDFGGRLVFTYDVDNKTKVQRWEGELTALCVPNRPNEMFYLIIK